MPHTARLVSDQADTADEKRRNARRRVLLSGKLVDEAGSFSTDCSIRNMSDSGAKLRMASPVPPGERLYLIELRTGTAHQVSVAWKQDGELGVRLDKQIQLRPQNAFDPSIRLRRLWVDAAC